MVESKVIINNIKELKTSVETYSDIISKIKRDMSDYIKISTIVGYYNTLIVKNNTQDLKYFNIFEKEISKYISKSTDFNKSTVFEKLLEVEFIEPKEFIINKTYNMMYSSCKLDTFYEKIVFTNNKLFLLYKNKLNYTFEEIMLSEQLLVELDLVTDDFNDFIIDIVNTLNKINDKNNEIYKDLIDIKSVKNIDSL